MSWTDLKSLEQVKKFQKLFNIEVFVETGTFIGSNAIAHSNTFDTVLTIEINSEYYWRAKKRLFYHPNVFPILGSSPTVLKKMIPFFKQCDMVFFYLDAHFYDPSLPKDERWVVLNELRALEGLTNCVIMIHDFKCNGLGHLNYDNQPLNFELVRDVISKVNPNFHYYFNAKSGCEIVTKDDLENGRIPGLVVDDDTNYTTEFVWSEPDNPHRAYRGMLYASPQAIDLTHFELVETD